MAVSGNIHFEVDGTTFIDHGDICGMCKNTASAGYCSECECYICQLCFDNHVRIQKNHHHVLQVAPGSKEDDHTVHFKTCTEHTQQEVRLYCTNHNVFGCGECMLFKHKSCKYKYITETSKEFQDSGELAHLIGYIQYLENIHDKCVESVASQSELSDSINKLIASDVQQFVKEVVSSATDDEKRIIKKADLQKSKNDDKIEKLSDDLQIMGSEITAVSIHANEEDQMHKLFILAVEAKPNLSQIRDTLASIRAQEIIDRYTFHPNRLLQRHISEKRPIGKLSDEIYSEDGEAEDYLSKYKAACMETEQLKQQLSTQEQILHTRKKHYQRQALQIQKLESDVKELMKINGLILACGHICDIDQMNENRTIKCPTCDIIFGDQPSGALETDANSKFIKLTLTFDKGVQSKLNLNPGKPYEGNEVTGYVRNDDDGRLILNMLKLAHDRKLLCTINQHGQIVMNGIHIFTNTQSRWVRYSTKVKEQLRAKGITEADVSI